MSIEITVPVLPESVADALLLDWNKQVGDSVSRDEILIEVETDKVVLEVPAPVDGVITEILQEAGATVMAGDVLARIETGAETAPASIDLPVEDESGVDSEQLSFDIDSLLSPAVRTLVHEHGLNPADIHGSGRDGRITKEDILSFISDQVDPDSPTTPSEPVSSPESVPVSPPPAEAVPEPAVQPVVAEPEVIQGREETREPMSRLRQTIATRLVQAQQTAALLTTFNEVNMQPVMDLRSRYKEDFETAHGTRLGFMSFFVKASVAALQKYPLVNAHIDGSDIVMHNYNDIGIAVSSPRGLLVPVVRNCEKLNFAEIESQIRNFGSRARDGKISLDDLTGGTFTITNGGVFGSLLSTPIVNPPQSAILGMHKIQPRPMAEDGQVVVRPMMYLALSYDHRIVDGREAVQFLVTIKDLLEDPARMLLQV